MKGLSRGHRGSWSRCLRLAIVTSASEGDQSLRPRARKGMRTQAGFIGRFPPPELVKRHEGRHRTCVWIMRLGNWQSWFLLSYFAVRRMRPLSGSPSFSYFPGYLYPSSMLVRVRTRTHFTSQCTGFWLFCHAGLCCLARVHRSVRRWDK